MFPLTGMYLPLGENVERHVRIERTDTRVATERFHQSANDA